MHRSRMMKEVDGFLTQDLADYMVKVHERVENLPNSEHLRLRGDAVALARDAARTLGVDAPTDELKGAILTALVMLRPPGDEEPEPAEPADATTA